MSWNGEKYAGGNKIKIKVTIEDLPFFKKIK